MTVEMATAEQQQYLRHDDDSESRLTPLSPVMPKGNKNYGKEDIATSDIMLHAFAAKQSKVLVSR